MSDSSRITDKNPTLTVLILSRHIMSETLAFTRKRLHIVDWPAESVSRHTTDSSALAAVGELLVAAGEWLARRSANGENGTAEGGKQERFVEMVPVRY